MKKTASQHKDGSSNLPNKPTKTNHVFCEFLSYISPGHFPTIYNPGSNFFFVLPHLHVHHSAKRYVSSQAYHLLQVSPFYEGLRAHT